MLLLILNLWLTRKSLRRGWRKSVIFTAWAVDILAIVLAYVLLGTMGGAITDIASNLVLTLFLIVLARTTPGTRSIAGATSGTTTALAGELSSQIR